MNAVDVRNLGVQVKGATLIDRIDLVVEPGEWLSIIGPNGAGKSTLLRAIAGVADASGTVHIEGAPLAARAGRERARLISWAPQTPTIPPGMRVLDYVLLGRTPHLHPLAAESSADLEITHEVLIDLDLVGLADRLVDTLSGGERQRTVIARALAQESPVILLDEPTSALDLGHQQDVLELLDRLRIARDRTIITTMHDLTLAGQFADRLVLMARGHIVAEGSASTVLTEQNIASHYGADVRVDHVDDAVVVVPRIRRSDSLSTPKDRYGN
ncbi:MAG: ABC transporter ATP-binding protein [Acidimicrobiales bacterium]